MIKGNRALRDYAIPFVSNFIEATDSGLWGSSALAVPQNITSTSRTAAVPMTQPDKGDVVEAYLFMEMTAPSNKALGVRLGIGTFLNTAEGPLITPTTNYTESYIASMHRRITGQDASLSVSANSTLIVDADLSRVLPKRGDASYLSDGFVLIITFDSLPSTDNGYSLDKFKLSCTAQMGLGT